MDVNEIHLGQRFRLLRVHRVSERKKCGVFGDTPRRSSRPTYKDRRIFAFRGWSGNVLIIDVILAKVNDSFCCLDGGHVFEKLVLLLIWVDQRREEDGNSSDLLLLREDGLTCQVSRSYSERRH